MVDSTIPAVTTRAAQDRWPGGLAGMLGLALVVELVLAHSLRFESPVMAIWRTDGRSSEGEGAASAEILCLGDSLVKTGVVPAVLEARLDRPTYNLATLGNPTPATYFLFKRALAAGATPRAIIVDAQSDKLRDRSYRTCVAAWAGLVGPAEALELARTDGDPGFFGLFLVHHLIPSIRLRLELRAAIAGLLAATELKPPIHWLGVIARQERRNRGALLFPPLSPAALADLDRRDVPVAIDPASDVVAANLSYLDRTLALARSRGIRAFVLVPPVHPDALKRAERLGLESSYLAIVRSIAERYENVVVIDGRRVVEDGDLFIDARQHLDVRGATAFSRALAEAIAPWLEGSGPRDRWIVLAADNEPSPRLAVETMDESQWAVAWQRTTR